MPFRTTFRMTFQLKLRQLMQLQGPWQPAAGVAKASSCTCFMRQAPSHHINVPGAKDRVKQHRLGLPGEGRAKWDMRHHHCPWETVTK